MNKIQKILWSIFSSLICGIYRSDAITVSITCPWTLVDEISGNEIYINGHSFNQHNCQLTANGTENLTNLNSDIEKIKNFEKTTGVKIISMVQNTDGSSCRYNFVSRQTNLYRNIFKPQQKRTSKTNSTSSLCDSGKYYNCSPTNNVQTGCCLTCPTPNLIAGVDEGTLFPQTTYEYLLVHDSIFSDATLDQYIILYSKTDIYGNSIGNEDVIQVYKHTPCVRAKQQTPKDCYIPVQDTHSDTNEYTAGEHSDHTGTYKYTANDKCYYENPD